MVDEHNGKTFIGLESRSIYPEHFDLEGLMRYCLRTDYESILEG